jgi:lipoate-protein ligase A
MSDPLGIEGSLRWTILVDGALPGAVNMARDAALTRLVSEAVEAAEGRGGAPRGAPSDPDAFPAFLRFYSWARPTLSFGRNEPALERFDPEVLDAAGVDVVRRPTGGRAVLHDREVTYAVVVPDRALGGPRESYRRIHAALAEGLRRLGADVSLASDRPTAPPDAGPCFDLPAGGEVVALGRKLVGSAQARLGRALLQHGSILLHDDQGRIGRLARDGASPTGVGVPTHPAALADLLDSAPTAAAVVARVIGAMTAAIPGTWPRELAGTGAADADPYAGLDDTIARFERDDWTWRR